MKAAGKKPAIDDGESITVFPDIIVHRRNTDDNLLVIEAKKTNSQIKEDYDREKLLAYKEQIKYRFAKFLKFGIGPKKRRIDANLFVEKMVKPRVLEQPHGYENTEIT